MNRPIDPYSCEWCSWNWRTRRLTPCREHHEAIDRLMANVRPDDHVPAPAMVTRPSRPAAFPVGRQMPPLPVPAPIVASVPAASLFDDLFGGGEDG